LKLGKYKEKISESRIDLNYFSRLEHALKEKENAQQQRDDMESKLNDLTQQK
jgi:hypothetical protein